MRRLIIAALASCATLAHAEFYSGNTLYSRMTNGDTYDRIHAQGYIAGVADSLHGVGYCPPPNVTLGQLFDIVKQLLEKNPDQRHKTADSFVSHAIMTAFPCQKSKRGNDA